MHAAIKPPTAADLLLDAMPIVCHCLLHAVVCCLLAKIMPHALLQQVKADEDFQVGFNRVYNSRLASSLSAIFRSHRHIFDNSKDPRPYDLDRAANSRTIREFDDAITRVSFGWPSVAEYYAGSGSCHSIPHVQIPLLCIQVRMSKGLQPY